LSSLVTKDDIRPECYYNKLPLVNHLPVELKMNYDQILKKPFYVCTITWNQTASGEFFRLPFPSCILKNPLVKVPFSSAAFYQMKSCFMIQVAGTAMHQGLVTVASIPHGAPAINNVNQILCAPHIFLNANESTATCLELPMYINSNVQRTPQSSTYNESITYTLYKDDFCDIVFHCTNTLAMSTGASQALSISVVCIIDEAEFYVPKIGDVTWSAECGISELEDKEIKHDSLCEIAISGDITCCCSNRHFKSEAGYGYNMGYYNNFQPNYNSYPSYIPPRPKKPTASKPTQIVDQAAKGMKSVAGDIIDFGRECVRILTGFHNPNEPKIDGKQLVVFRNYPNNVDETVRYEVMDNHSTFSRIYDDFYFRTDIEEMSVNNLIRKPVFIGTMNIHATTTTGTLLCAYPISPMVETKIDSLGGFNPVYCSPLRTLYEKSLYWRGSMKLHIQTVATSLHYTKIVVHKNYFTTNGMSQDNTQGGSPKKPIFSDISNSLVDTIEISGGGQIQTIDLPFCSQYKQLYCTKDFNANAINHGVFYIYLAQPLVFNANVPQSISCNLYLSAGDDFQFSGYALEPCEMVQATDPVYPPISLFKDGTTAYYDMVEKEVTQLNKNKMEIKKIKFPSGYYLTTDEQKSVKIQRRKEAFNKNKKLQKPYIVKEGDTWEIISEITGTDTKDLIYRNRVRNRAIFLKDANKRKDVLVLLPNDRIIWYLKSKLEEKAEKRRTGVHIIDCEESWDEVAYTSGNFPPENNLTIPESLKEKFDTNALYHDIYDIMYKAESGDSINETNTLIQPSSQETLLLDKRDSEGINNMHFRPNTSIRDYMRIMIPQRPIILDGFTQTHYAKHTIKLAEFFMSNFDASSFTELSSLFFGMSGGVKLKFKIFGATAGSLEYNPPSIFNTGGLEYSSTTGATVTTVASADYFNKSDGFAPSQLGFSRMQVELQDMTRPMTVFTGQPTSNVFELECAVPNMNIGNIVCSSSKYYGVTEPTFDLGEINLNFYIGGNITATNREIYILPFIGINDETRLGFQSFAPLKQIKTYSINSDKFRVTAQHKTDNGFRILPALNTSCYYFSS